MPKIYAPKDITVTTIYGTGINLKKGETREVGDQLFAEALAQGALAAEGAYVAAAAHLQHAEIIPRHEPVPVERVFDAPSPDGATILEDGEETEEERYPPGVTTAAVLPGGNVDAVYEALRRIAHRNDPRDFNANGVPKARALTAEMGGIAVVAEVREEAWETVLKELGR